MCVLLCNLHSEHMFYVQGAQRIAEQAFYVQNAQRTLVLWVYCTKCVAEQTFLPTLTHCKHTAYVVKAQVSLQSRKNAQRQQFLLYTPDKKQRKFLS